MKSIFCGKANLHSEAETDFIGNHWGLNFPKTKAKEYDLEDSKNVQCKQLNRDIEPLQQISLKQPEESKNCEHFEYLKDLNTIIKEIARDMEPIATQMVLGTGKLELFFDSYFRFDTQFQRTPGQISLVTKWW